MLAVGGVVGLCWSVAIECRYGSCGSCTSSLSFDCSNLGPSWLISIQQIHRRVHNPEVGWPSTRTFDRQPCHLPICISHSPELATACVDVRGTIYSIDPLINHPRTDTAATLAWPEHTKFPSLPIRTAHPPKIHRCLRPLCVYLPISLQNRFSPSGGDRDWMGSRRS